MALQPDPTRAPRDAFTRCLFAYVDKAAQDRTSRPDFDTQFAQQCQNEEQSFRTAIRASAGRMPAAEVEEIQKMEVEDSRLNAKARFEDATTPRA
jgi:hypothetical protein